MARILGPILWIGIIAHAVAAWTGCSYLIGPVVGSIVFGVCLFLRITFWMPIAAFVGAWAKWRWPWYGALAISLPGVVAMLPVGAAMLGANVMDRLKRRASVKP